MATSLGQAREAVSKAALAYDEALAELEGASARGPDAVEAAHARLREASVQMARAQAEIAGLSASAGSPTPGTFEALLRSGSVGFDLRGEVMASIVAYQAATSATLSGPSLYGERSKGFGWAGAEDKATSATSAA